jgi:pilus assembly protein CpaB
MRWTILGLLFVGIIAAAAAALLAVAIQAKGNTGTHVDPGSEQVDVLIASQDLSAMTQVEAEMLKVTKVARSHLPEKSYSVASEVIGQILIGDIKQGQMLSEKLFANADSNLKVVQALKPGERAMAVMLTSESGIEDLLYPGCVVDVVASIRVPRDDGDGGTIDQYISTTPIKAVQVLAVGKRSIIDRDGGQNSGGGDSKRGRMVTLKVNSDEAQALQLAATQGQISVALRNPLDKGTEDIPGTTIGQFAKGLSEQISSSRRKMTNDTGPLTLGTVPSTMPTATQPTGVLNVINTPGHVEPAKPQTWGVTLIKGNIVQELQFPMTSDLQRRKR